MELTDFVAQRWRLAGNIHFDECIYEIEKHLKRAGYSQDNQEDLSYRIEKYPLRTPAWLPRSASLRLGDEKLLDFQSNRNMICINSFDTNLKQVPLVYLDNCSEESFQNSAIKGKIVMAPCHAYPLFRIAVQKYGAIGVLSYSIPGFNQPDKFVNSIPFSSIPYNNELGSWAINLSQKVFNRLKEALSKDTVLLDVMIDTEFRGAEELTIIAEIKGSVQPEERFVYSAHIQEPGANDNASGVGVLAEIASQAARFYQQSQKPKRTMTFIWGDEIVSTRRYIQQDSVRAKKIKWGLSLDMVGENTSITGGSFLIEKMPDPSAIWTRGKDKHTEWGAGQVDTSDFNPHYFNDLTEYICRQQAMGKRWKVSTNPYEGGSDHQPFLDAKIPGLLLWHFTDVFYHTDADRIDKVSPETLKNVGVSALTLGWFLVNADLDDQLKIDEILAKASKKRLKAEWRQSRSLLKVGDGRSREKNILLAWRDWYSGSFASVQDLSSPDSPKFAKSALFNKSIRRWDKKISKLD